MGELYTTCRGIGIWDYQTFSFSWISSQHELQVWSMWHALVGILLWDRRNYYQMEELNTTPGQSPSDSQSPSNPQHNHSSAELRGCLGRLRGVLALTHNLILRRSKILWSWLKVLTKWWLLLEEDLTLARRLSFLLPQHNENPLMRSFPEGTQCLNFSTVYLPELGDWQRIPSFSDDSQTFDIASSLSPQKPNRR
jgi:hypothetical protein